MTSDRLQQLVASFADKEYRDATVEAEIDELIAAQIRASREARGWTQKQLGERAGMAQETVSQLENPNYGRYSLRTLKRLAGAFDIALSVRFQPFSELARQMADLSAADLAIPSFTDELCPEAAGPHAGLSAPSSRANPAPIEPSFRL